MIVSLLTIPAGQMFVSAGGVTQPLRFLKITKLTFNTRHNYIYIIPILEV